MKEKHPVFTVEGNNIVCHFLPHQLKAKDSKQQITGIVGGRGCGKSIFLSAMALLEILQGGKIILFGTDYKTLTITLFGEIIKRFRECGLEPKINYQDKIISYGNGTLYGFSYESIDKVRGLSECSMLMLDELALAPANILEVATPCLRGSGRRTRILFATSPNKATVWNKWFRDKSDKDVFTATMFDNTELSEEDIELQKKAIKDEQGYRQEILGEILDADVQFCVISKSEFPMFYKGPFGIRRMGIDCAGSGADYNVFVVVDDNGILEVRKEQHADTFGLFAIAKELIQKWDVKSVNIDVTGGFGNGIYDMLKMNYTKVQTNGVNFGQKANKDCYANARAEMYFDMAEKVRNGFFVDNEDIKDELSYTSYNVNATGKTMLVKKEEIKELIGHSPDTTDAFCLALYNTNADYISPEESLNIAMKFVKI